MIELLSFPPVFRGFVSLLAAGLCFPLSGIFILRLNLLNLRFMLMHGVMLAGAIALSASLDPLLCALGINLFLVLLITSMSRRSDIPTGGLTTFFMVISVGVAMALIYKNQIPVQDTMNLLWGSIFALSQRDLFLLLFFCLVILLFVLFKYRQISAVLIDPETARTAGVNETLIFYLIMIFTGITIAFAMRLVGALLLDALVLLPAMTAVSFSRSLKSMFITASLSGFLYSLGGFLLALKVDLPVSSGVILVAGVCFGITYIVRLIYEKHN
ncbi:metal ABC transporter permease [Oceanispirochaeta crateris]|jgi:zinc transport system permease protein|nr:metal ABC transporter permease [Oceanispirochaeta crateris]